MDLQKIYNLCTELKSISSNKEKEQFLVDNRCDDFDEFLKWLLDPQIVTGIDKKKLFKDTGIESPSIYEPMAGCINNLEELLRYLKENDTGRDIDVWYCQKYINNYCYMMGQSHDDWANFLVDVFTKRLKLGVNFKTINKAYGKDFIHVHEVQLGSPFDKLRLKPNESFFITRKLNGVRCTYVNGELISRQGTIFKGLSHISSTLRELEKYLGNESWVFDGELINNNDGSLSDNDNFRLGTGIINSDSADKSNIKLIMFDILPTKEFFEGESKIKYKERREMLDDINNWLKDYHYYSVEVTPLLYYGSDKSKIDEWLSYANAHDWEGCMVNLNKPYVTKRTTSLIKVKSFKHSDLRIVDCLEGDGKYKCSLGSFVVQFKNNTVNVGSGFTDQQRKEYWANKDILIGKICQVKYKEISKDKDTGLESLQFPVFEMLRDDKNTESYE